MRVLHSKKAVVIKRIFSFIIAFVLVLSLLGNGVNLAADETTPQKELTVEDDSQTNVDESQNSGEDLENTEKEDQKQEAEDALKQDENKDENQDSSSQDEVNSGEINLEEGNDDSEKSGEENVEVTQPEGTERDLGISLTSVDVSVGTVLPSGSSGSIAVIRLSDSTYTTYPASLAGLRAALFYMYENGSGAGDDYILYIGGTSGQTISVSADTVAAVIPAAPSAANMTFYALQDKIGTLVITGAYDDPLGGHTTAPTGARILNAGGGNDWNLGTDTVFRNIRYAARSLYANGHNLTLAGGSYHNSGISIYGGGASGTVSGDIVMDVYSTGTGNVNIVGANNTGTFNGNIQTTIYNSSGNRINFYGGGLGESNENRVQVNGNVTSEIKNLGSGSLGIYYGAGEYSNVTGTVRNTITGPGSNGSHLGGGVKFIGGARCGDIGSDRNGDAIVNYVDFREYKGGSNKNFVGANGNTSTGADGGSLNSSAGIIRGNITNVVYAGDYGTPGEINGVTGGGDYNTAIAGGSRTNGFDNAEDAKAAAAFQVYGNIHTTLPGGCYARTDIAHYARSAGFGGYIEGNTTILVGTESLAYGRQKPTGNIYKVNTGGRNGLGPAHDTYWDIVGGGGQISQGRNIYIKGDTKVVHHNSFARWTYGGSFGGTIEGNTTNEMYGGRVHTLEGAGYDGYLVKGGESHAIVHYGQVDWFLAGGGWADRRIENNVNVTVEDGIINAYVGGNYGVYSDNIVTGNATINIYGGDFSGWAHNGATNPSALGPKAISGGPTANGVIEGNITVNIDYSNNPDPNAIFELPPNCYISGGTPYNSSASNVKVGTRNRETSIVMNIKAGGDGSTDALAGASIYGDGGVQSSGSYNAFSSTSTSLGNTPMCYAKNIVMNIDAPGSSIGQLYATNSKNELNRNVEINVLSAKSIVGINGGSGRGAYTADSADNYTNTVVSGAGTFGGQKNRSKINVGTADGDPFFVTIGNGGIKNFTDLTVDQAIFYATGTVVNGAGAENTAVETRITNHGSTYSQFGDITLKNNAGFGVANNRYAVGGKLIVEGEESTITSPSGRGNFIITDFVPNQSRVVWSRNGGDGTYSHTGAWFGTNMYYRVFTFSPRSNFANAGKIIPTGLRGIDPTTYKTYIGDNSVADGYGLALPGSFIEYQVVDPKGHITHDVAEASDGSEGLPIKAYGSVKAGVEAQSGILAIPSSLGIKPTLTFTPAMKESDPSIPEYWIKKVVVEASDHDLGAGSHSSEIEESDTYDPETWTSPDGEYSYLIDTSFTNEAEALGLSILITEDEAAAIADAAELIEMMEASGRPFFDHNIDLDDLLTAIKVPLNADEFARKHEITYKAGVSQTPNSVSIIRNVVVVKNGTEISENRSVGLYAQNASMFLEDANELVDQAELDTNYTKAIAIENDGLIYSASITNDAFNTIKNATTLQSVPVYYSYTGSGENPESVTKDVIVEIIKTAIAFNFIKIDATDYRADPSVTTPLPEAEFTLAKLNGETETNPVNVTSGLDGIVDFGMLEAGDYILRETKAPLGGYVLPKGYWKIKATPRDKDPAKKLVIEAYTQFDEPRGEGLLMPGDFIASDEGYLLLNEKGENVQFTKVDEDTIKETPFALASAEFELYTINPDQTEQKYDSIQSDILGNVNFGRLPDGNYRIKEVLAPIGYDTPGGSWVLEVDNSNESNPFTYTKEGTDHPDMILQSGNYLAPNKKTKIAFTLQKVDIDTVGSGTPAYLADAEFTLYRLNQNSNGDDERELIDDTLISLADGTFAIELQSGRYILEETKAPSGYVTPTGYWVIEIDATKPSVTDGSVKITAYSADGRVQKEPANGADPMTPVLQDTGIPPRPIYVSGGEDERFLLPNEKGVGFDFLKVDESTIEDASPVFLANAEFKLYILLSGSGNTEEILYKTVTSDENGDIDFGILPDGTYRLEETDAPTDYVKPSGSWNIQVTKPANPSSVPYEGITITNIVGNDNVEPPTFIQKAAGSEQVMTYFLTNEREGTDFSFTKVNDKVRDDSGALMILKGAQFKLYMSSGESPGTLVTEESIAAGDWTLLDEQTTGDDGVIEYEKLEDGNYMLVETKAPLGYETPYGQWLIVISKNESEPISITAKERDGAGLPPAFKVETAEGEKLYFLPNFKQFALPFSGNIGIYGFIAVGLILILGSIAGYKMRQKKRYAKVRSALVRGAHI